MSEKTCKCYRTITIKHHPDSCIKSRTVKSRVQCFNFDISFSQHWPDFKSQPEPSPVLSQLTQRQQQQMQVVPVPPPGLESSTSQLKLREPSPVDTSTAVSKILQLPSISMDNQAVTVHQTQQKQIKPPKRRITPASKVGNWVVACH